ncbi:MAG: hypothetical protein PHT13_00335 [Methanosarcina sp.]|nr:hypothetical protein [Methanosarcina sp.]
MIDMLSIIKGQTGDKWPRGMGNPFRADRFGNYFIARSAQDVLDFMEENNFKTLYGTVYSFTEYNFPKEDRDNAVIDCIPFDFDCAEANEDALLEMRFVIDWCIRHSIEPRVTFSGSKGFHLVIDFDDVDLKYPRETIRKFAFSLITGGKLKCVDNTVLGDVNRILRFINTQHSKTLMYCIPLTITEALTLSIEEIHELAKTPRDMIPVRNLAPEIVRETLKEIDREVTREKRIAKLEGSALQNIWCSSPRRSDGKCLAFEHIKEFGASMGTRDATVCGLVHYFRSKQYDRRQILEEIKAINETFKPPTDRASLEYKIEYHMRNDYSFCTFFREPYAAVCANCHRSK